MCAKVSVVLHGPGVILYTDCNMMITRTITLGTTMKITFAGPKRKTTNNNKRIAATTTTTTTRTTAAAARAAATTTTRQATEEH